MVTELLASHKAERPDWWDVTPKDDEQKDAYDIAAKYYNRFAKAFLDSMDSLNDIRPSAQKISSAIRTSKNPKQAALKIIDKNHPAFSEFAEKATNAYGQIMKEAANREYKRLGFVVKQDVDIDAFDLDNPYSRQFMSEQEVFLISYFSEEKVRQVTSIVRETFLGRESSGVAARRILELDFALLPKHAASVERRTGELFDSLVREGADPDRAAAMAEKFNTRETKRLRKWRAEAIARTETVRAQARGLSDSWNVARDEGVIDGSAKKEWIAGVGSDRTCPICLGLDGERVDLNATFSTGVSAPPAHVMCRCTMGLYFGK